MASLVFDPQRGSYVAVPGEGAHATVPVNSAREFAVVEWLLRDKYSHVSVERVCSGKGLANLYGAIRAIDGRNAVPELAPEDITTRALSGECDVCREALTLMMGFLGRVAGNLALTINATGGIYFAGGILPKLGAGYVEGSRLRGSFTAKGRFTAYVDRIPTFLIEDPFLPLRGLRRYALESRTMTLHVERDGRSRRSFAIASRRATPWIRTSAEALTAACSPSTAIRTSPSRCCGGRAARSAPASISNTPPRMLGRKDPMAALDFPARRRPGSARPDGADAGCSSRSR